MKTHVAGLAGLMLFAALPGQALAEETILRVSSGSCGWRTA